MAVRLRGRGIMAEGLGGGLGGWTAERDRGRGRDKIRPSRARPVTSFVQRGPTPRSIQLSIPGEARALVTWAWPQRPPLGLCVGGLASTRDLLRTSRCKP